MSSHYPTPSLAWLVLLSGLAASSSVQADAVTDWNSIALDAVIAARETSTDPGPQHHNGSRRYV